MIILKIRSLNHTHYVASALECNGGGLRVNRLSFAALLRSIYKIILKIALKENFHSKVSRNIAMSEFLRFQIYKKLKAKKFMSHLKKRDAQVFVLFLQKLIGCKLFSLCGTAGRGRTWCNKSYKDIHNASTNATNQK